jgi:hypothetical protein
MITISGTYADPSDAAVPAAGQVSLLLDPQDRTGDLVQRTQGPLTAVLDDTGTFTLQVPDSSDFSAGESQWHVRESVSGLTRVWTLHLAASDDGQEVDLPSRYPGLDEQRYAVLPLPGPEGPAGRDMQVRQELGDPALLTQMHPAHDLVHWLVWLEGRITALEAAGGGSPVVPTAEGSLEVDLYSGSFVRARDTGNVLGDGQDHWVDFALATVAGPGGAVIDPMAGVPAGSAKVWYDQGGQLGGMVGPTGTDVTQTTLRNWVKYGRDAVPGQPQYVLLAHVDTTVEPGHPRLVISNIVTLG